MPSPATKEEATGLTVEEKLGEKGHEGARVSVGTATAAAKENGGVEARPPSGPTCCICMEPWTCNDGHRICCIPYGHVYGRSCLEKWLHLCSESSAKCPQCGEPFAYEHIINLYAPGNLWGDCCRLQELQAHYDSAIAKILEQHDEQEKKLMQLDHRANLLTHVVANVVTRIRTEFVSMKEQMKKLIEENATPMDLIGFMEDDCTKLWDWIPFQPRGGS